MISSKIGVRNNISKSIDGKISNEDEKQLALRLASYNMELRTALYTNDFIKAEAVVFNGYRQNVALGDMLMEKTQDYFDIKAGKRVRLVQDPDSPQDTFLLKGSRYNINDILETSKSMPKFLEQIEAITDKGAYLLASRVAMNIAENSDFFTKDYILQKTIQLIEDSPLNTKKFEAIAFLRNEQKQQTYH